MRDKDLSSVISLIPKSSVMYWCAADIPRAMNVTVLNEIGEKNGLLGYVFDTVEDAVTSARKRCYNVENSKAIVCGSIFVVGDALKIYS